MTRPAFDPSRLRQRAERQIALGDLPSKLGLDPIRLLHELQVHKIELELQNEELISANIELEAMKRRYETLYRHAPSGFVTTSLTGVLSEANERAFDMLKRNPSQLLGQPLRGCFAEQSQAEFDSLLSCAASPERIATADNLLVFRPQSVPIWVKVRCHCIHIHEGEPPVILIALTDVSALKYAVEDALSRLDP